MTSTLSDLDSFKITPLMLQITLGIVNQLKSDPSDITFKDFLLTYLLATDSDATLNNSHRYWAGSVGWPSTLLVLKAIRRLICQKKSGQKLWKVFILSEVSESIADKCFM
jgi:hypothetical protein